MEKQKHAQTAIIGVLAVAILVMAVGFALYNAELQIGGTANVTAASWNVHFVTSGDGTYALSSGSVTPSTTPTVTGTSVSTYNITLAKPGDFYEFTIDVVNEGTIDAKLTGITLSSLDASAAPYVAYTVYYNDTPYTVTTDTSSSNIILTKASGSNATDTVKVRVEYKTPTQENPTLLAESLTGISLTATLNYVDAGF